MNSTSPTLVRREASRSVLGARGVPALVRRTSLVAATVEGVAFASEVIRETAALQTLGATGNRMQVVNAAGRLGSLAEQYREEFRRLAGEVED